MDGLKGRHRGAHAAGSPQLGCRAHRLPFPDSTPPMCRFCRYRPGLYPSRIHKPGRGPHLLTAPRGEGRRGCAALRCFFRCYTAPTITISPSFRETVCRCHPVEQAVRRNGRHPRPGGEEVCPATSPPYSRTAVAGRHRPGIADAAAHPLRRHPIPHGQLDHLSQKHRRRRRGTTISFDFDFDADDAPWMRSTGKTRGVRVKHSRGPPNGRESCRPPTASGFMDCRGPSISTSASSPGRRRRPAGAAPASFLAECPPHAMPTTPRSH